MIRKQSAKKPSFRVSDRVVRNKAVGGKEPGDLLGTVRRVTKAPFSAGGTRARIRVLWDNGHETSVEDRQLLAVKPCVKKHQP